MKLEKLPFSPQLKTDKTFQRNATSGLFSSSRQRTNAACKAERMQERTIKHGKLRWRPTLLGAVFKRKAVLKFETRKLRNEH